MSIGSSIKSAVGKITRASVSGKIHQAEEIESELKRQRENAEWTRRQAIRTRDAKELAHINGTTRKSIAHIQADATVEASKNYRKKGFGYTSGYNNGGKHYNTIRLGGRRNGKNRTQ